MAMSVATMVLEAVAMARGKGQNGARVAHVEGVWSSEEEAEGLIEEWDGGGVLGHDHHLQQQERHQQQQEDQQPSRRRGQRHRRNRLLSKLGNCPLSYCFTGTVHIGSREPRMASITAQMSSNRHQIGGHIREDHNHIHLRMATAMSIVYGWLI